MKFLPIFCYAIFNILSLFICPFLWHSFLITATLQHILHNSYLDFYLHRRDFL